MPLDKKLPKLRLRSTQLARLVGQRFVVHLDAWDPTSSYPSCHVIRVLGQINDVRFSAPLPPCFAAHRPSS